MGWNEFWMRVDDKDSRHQVPGALCFYELPLYSSKQYANSHNKRIPFLLNSHVRTARQNGTGLKISEMIISLRTIMGCPHLHTYGASCTTPEELIAHARYEGKVIDVRST